MAALLPQQALHDCNFALIVKVMQISKKQSGEDNVQKTWTKPNAPYMCIYLFIYIYIYICTCIFIYIENH